MAFSMDLWEIKYECLHCIAGLGNFFGEKNLRLNMEKNEELKVVENELWNQFQHYLYVLNF